MLKTIFVIALLYEDESMDKYLLLNYAVTALVVPIRTWNLTKRYHIKLFSLLMHIWCIGDYFNSMKKIVYFVTNLRH